MISQIPETVFLVTLGRSQRKSAKKTLFSFHHIEINLFNGFELHEKFSLALPEKALFDFFYFSATRTNIFKSLPELDFPKGFKKKKMYAWCQLIENSRLRSHVHKKIEDAV